MSAVRALYPDRSPPADPRLARERALPRISFRPGARMLGRFIGKGDTEIVARATDRWQIAPGGRTQVKRARFLDGQLERIQGSEFGTLAEVVRDFSGGFEAVQAGTYGYRLRDVLLHDGVLYSSGAVQHLRSRSNRAPAAIRAEERSNAAVYESWLGNRWFGNWLSDDCLTYRLAEEAGQPFTTSEPTGHKQDYEHRLDIRPERGSTVWFRELTLFDDTAHNAHKRMRAEHMRRRLTGAPADRHPGVFLLRGRTGDARRLSNERAIAEGLAARRGFQVIDPSTSSVEEIVRACGGAKIVAGVEGSHLVHGLVTMPPDACALVIQPPFRAVSALKLLTDRQGQDYALVVGQGGSDAFTADLDEIERTLDLV